MSFLPVGRRLHMQSQTFKIAQSQIAQPDANSFYMENGVSSPIPQGEMGSDSLQHSAPQGEADGGDGVKQSSLREAVFEVLETLGVEKRHLTDPKMSKRIFSQKQVLGSGNVVGHFMLPSATEKQRISESDASEIAMKILNAFGLEGDMGHEGRNFVVHFRNKSQEVQSAPSENDSFSELSGGGGKKEASVFGELMMQRKAMLSEGLRRAGFRI